MSISFLMTANSAFGVPWGGHPSDIGPYSHQITERAQVALLSAASPANRIVEQLSPEANPNAPLEEQLYNARAAFKLRIANVAMHLDQTWRKRFFAQLDHLLDVNEWDKRDLPVTEQSFATLLRMLLLVKPKLRPGLGATSGGNIIAAWTVSKDRLTIECLPADEVRWVVVHYLDGERETGAGQVTLTRLINVLSPYNPNRWFANDGSETPA
jgi:hypothetical protein